MLKEIRNVRQISGEPHRNWFTSEDMDLVVWLNASNEPVQLQLCYDKGRAERALTWHPDTGYTHTAVDDGENRDGHYKATPILLTDGDFDSRRVGNMFLENSKELPSNIVAFVATKIDEYGSGYSDFLCLLTERNPSALLDNSGESSD